MNLDERLARELELKTNTIRQQLDFYGLNEEQREKVIRQVAELAGTIVDLTADQLGITRI